MRKLLCWSLILCALLAGCSGKEKADHQTTVSPVQTTPTTKLPATQPATEPAEILLPPAEPLALFVETEMQMDNEGSVYATVEYPVLQLGYMDYAGTIRDDQGWEALALAVENYNRDIRGRQEAAMADLKTVAQQAPEGAELFSRAQLFVTRNDSAILSFYEKTVADKGGTTLETELMGHSWLAATAEPLQFAEVFTDTGELAQVLDSAFRGNYPEYDFPDNSAELILSAIEYDGRELSFALGYDGVHIFAQAGWLGETDAMHIPLAYRQYPQLVKTAFTEGSDSWLTKPEYDLNLPVGPDITMTMHWQPVDVEESTFSLTVNDYPLDLPMYGAEPDCYLLHDYGKYYLYLQIPRGDISLETHIYALSESGAEPAGVFEGAIMDTTPLLADRMAVALNRIASPGNFLLLPWSSCHTEEGIPVMGADFGVQCRPLTLTCSVEVQNADPETADFVPGTHGLEAGSQLMPFRTDMETYLDFLDEEGNACRFTISSYGDDMEFPGYPTPGELLE